MEEMPGFTPDLLDPEVFKDIVDRSGDGVYIMDTDRRIVYWNRGAEEISGYSAGDAVGRHCRDNLLVHVDTDARPLCLGACPALDAMRRDAVVEGDVFLHHRDGHRVPIRVRVAPLKAPDGTVVGGVEVFRDNREGVAARSRIEELERLSHLDALTGIGNRRYAESYLAARLSEFERYGWGFGVVFFDIDHFKQVNDTWGHDAGDKVLRMVAMTAGNSVRTSDVVSRWGGEEFTAFIQRVDEVELRGVAETMRRLVQESGLYRGEERVSVTISSGATMARAGDTVQSLIERADRLMYRSKEEGRNRVTLG